METEIRGLPKNWIFDQFQECRDLSEEMKETMIRYLLSLHGVKDDTKSFYLSRVKMLGIFLAKKRIMVFEDVKSLDIDLFLSQYENSNTLNLYIYVFKQLYKFLKLPEVVNHLKYYKIELEQITPSETLTPEEVVKIANESSKRREIYKVIVLTLFESCARINELLHLRLGDVVFSSVVDKEKHRKIIATLHFKRSKGGVKKQPVGLVMFASELKRWCDNHPYKSDKQAYLFPSPSNNGEHISDDTVRYALWRAGTRLGINKRLNPHWLRHSGLSFFANKKNYSETLLMWRAGWTNTSMARRYIHSGAELENKIYIERMGLVVEQKEEQITITSKNCPHCQAPNPYTNSNCDFCAMPLDPEEYQKEIEKRRDMERYYETLQKMNTGKLDKDTEKTIDKMIETLTKAAEIERFDLVKDYLKLTLITWAKIFVGK